MTHATAHDAGPAQATAAADVPGADLGRRIEVARILLIVGLVFLHYGRFPGSDLDPHGPYHLAPDPVAAFAAGAVWYFFLSAVPLLSMVSGFLFVRSVGTAPGRLGRVLARKARTLLLPLLLWNGAAVAAAIAVLALVPGARLPGLTLPGDGSAGLWAWLDAVIGVTRAPVLFQFWFVRDLVVTVAVSPLLLAALRHAPWAGAAILGGAWLAGHGLWVFLRPDVVFFFYAGGLLAQARTGWATRLPVTGKACALAVAGYGLLVLLRTAVPGLGLAQGLTDADLELLTRLMRLPGVVACWMLAGAAAQGRLGPWLERGGSFAFFIFAAHFPMVRLVKEVVARLLPAGAGTPGTGWLLFHYLASVALTVVLCLVAARLLSRWWPGLYSLASGGRELARGGGRKLARRGTGGGAARDRPPRPVVPVRPAGPGAGRWRRHPPG